MSRFQHISGILVCICLRLYLSLIHIQMCIRDSVYSVGPIYHPKLEYRTDVTVRFGVSNIALRQHLLWEHCFLVVTHSCPSTDTLLKIQNSTFFASKKTLPDSQFLRPSNISSMRYSSSGRGSKLCLLLLYQVSNRRRRTKSKRSEHTLSLIHIQMCIRDRFQIFHYFKNLVVYLSLRIFFHLNGSKF